MQVLQAVSRFLTISTESSLVRTVSRNSNGMQRYATSICYRAFSSHSDPNPPINLDNRKINQHIVIDHDTKTSYYNIPQFGSGYKQIHPTTLDKIRKLECKLIETPEIEINDSVKAAKKQQENFLKYNPPDTGNGFFSRIQNYFSPPYSLQVVPTSTIEKLKPILQTIQSPNVVISSTRGRRSYMEDAYLDSEFEVNIKQKIYAVKLTGLFDGHGGPECAAFVSKHMANELKTRLEQFNYSGLTDNGILNAITMSFINLGQGVSVSKDGLQVPVSPTTTGREAITSATRLSVETFPRLSSPR